MISEKNSKTIQIYDSNYQYEVINKHLGKRYNFVVTKVALGSAAP